jgi:hypothetical protein
MTVKKWLLAALCIGIVVSAAFWVHRQLSIDDCLDGGGSWNYENEQCDDD